MPERATAVFPKVTTSIQAGNVIPYSTRAPCEPEYLATGEFATGCGITGMPTASEIPRLQPWEEVTAH